MKRENPEKHSSRELRWFQGGLAKGIIGGRRHTAGRNRNASRALEGSESQRGCPFKDMGKARGSLLQRELGHVGS